MNKYIRKILVKITGIGWCDTPRIQMEKIIINDNDLKEQSNLKKVADKDKFETLHDYYNIQYYKDLDILKNTFITDRYTKTSEDKLFFVKDLEDFKKSKHPLLNKKHFMYFLAIHTAFLMEVHKFFPEKYDEFKHLNKGMVFEYGLTNTFMYPWEILQRLHISFDKKLFSDCLGLVMSEMMTDYYFCGIIPRDFIDKFIDDPDLNNPKTPYGKEWKEIAEEEWFQVVKSICPKI